MSPVELQDFYEHLVRQLRSRGVLCAITSGLACVHYGVSETTRDCDLLCHPNSFSELLDLLSETQLGNNCCHYRGNISPPLDSRWHRGGWTSHFEWGSGTDAVTLDIFGHPPRETAPWGQQMLGLYAGPHTVAEMKRTNRDKDWAVVTALGLRMLEVDDERGWLHVFDADVLMQLLATRPCPAEMINRRPALKLGIEASPQLAGAVNAERRFWEELDRRRIQLLEQQLRAYVSAVRKERANRDVSLLKDHELRVSCALQHLPLNPLKEYGTEQYLKQAQSALVESGVVPERALTWLPDVAIYFNWVRR